MDTQTITALAQARREHENSMAELRHLEATFKNSMVWQAMANVERIDAQLLEEADAAFRQEALSNYGVDQNKHQDCYDIKLVQSVSIPDEGAAIRWCVTNFTPALTINKKVFETAVKAGSIPADIAFALEQPKVFIKSDLSEWLKEEVTP